MRQQNLLTWLRWLTQWVRRVFLGQRTNERLLKVIERIDSRDELTVLVSVERDAPGAIATWYLLHRDNPHNMLLVTLDNLSAIRLALRNERPQGIEKSALELSLIDEGTVIRTHRFSIQWLIKLNNSRTVFSLIGTWDADLQGTSFDPNANAITIFRYMMREALNLRPIPGMSWRVRMNNFPWTETVQSYAHHVLGEKHNCHIKKLNVKKLKELTDQRDRGRTE